jgi:hypothetical protein
MEKSFLKTGLAGLLTLTLVASPTFMFGQGTNTNKAPAEKKAATKDASADKKASAGPFHGKLAALDKAAKTITVGKRTFQITSETKIHKAGKPATFEEGVVGEEVSGYIKPADDGKLIATTVNFGPKVETKGSEKSAEKKKEKQTP